MDSVKEQLVALTKIRALDWVAVVFSIFISSVLKTVIIRLLNKPLAEEQKNLYVLQKKKEKLLKEDASDEELKNVDEEIKEQKKTIMDYRRQAGFNPLPMIIGMVISRVMMRGLRFYFEDIVGRRPIAFTLPKGIISKDSFIGSFLSKGIPHPTPGDVSFYFLMRIISPMVSKYIISPLLKVPKQPSFFEKLMGTYNQLNNGMGNMPGMPNFTQ